MFEKYLRNSKNIEVFLDIIEHPVYIKNSENIFIYANKAFLMLFNYDKKSIYGLSENQLLGLDTNIFKKDASCLSSGQSLKEQLTFISSKQGKRVLLTSKYFINEDALGFEGLLSISIEISEIGKTNSRIDDFADAFMNASKKVEEAEALKSEIIANISHEMKTPISHIIGFAELLLSDNDIAVEKRSEYLFHVYSAAHKLNSVIDDMLEVSQIKSGNMQIYKELFCITDLVSEIFNFYKNEINFRGIKYSLVFNGINALYSDGFRVKQVLTNLVDNAIKFTRHGRIDFELNIENDFYMFRLTDTGCGIDKKYHKRIFEDFFMIDQGLLKKYQGTGLGLYVSKAIVESLGGRIWVESQKDVGSSFYFRLPYIKES